ASRPGRAPRVPVSRAVALLAAGATMIAYTSRYALDRAEQNASAHTSFIARTIVRDRLRRADLERPVMGRQQAILDRLFTSEVLVDGALRVKLYRRDGRVTYSNSHDLIGTRPGEQTVENVFRTGQAATDVAHLNDEGGRGPNTKALETY